MNNTSWLRTYILSVNYETLHVVLPVDILAYESQPEDEHCTLKR